MLNSFRTDMAAEACRIHGNVSGLPGVCIKNESLQGFPLCEVEISDDEAAQALKKPIGKYFTLELDRLLDRGDEAFPGAAMAVAEILRRVLGRQAESVLIAALGNPDITPDALGSLAASSIIVTRHLKERGDSLFESFSSVALCRTGVLGTTGIESAAQIKALCAAIQPDAVIAIDALAGAEAERLCRSIQISSSGIAPGSGVGNNREALNEEFLSVPVIAIGVPTVIDASNFADSAALRGLFVTPRSIDSDIRGAGRTIAYGINLALNPGLSISDIDMLVG